MNFTEIRRRNLKSGTLIYACAYSYTGTKEHRRFFSEPTLGILSYTDKPYFKDTINKADSQIRYFIPYKKNSKDLSYDNLAFSKAVKLDARYYAETEQECKEIYNSLIQRNIDWHLSEIELLKKNLI